MRSREAFVRRRANSSANLDPHSSKAPFTWCAAAVLAAVQNAYRAAAKPGPADRKAALFEPPPPKVEEGEIQDGTLALGGEPTFEPAGTDAALDEPRARPLRCVAPQ